MSNHNYIKLMNESIIRLFKKAMKVSLTNPSRLVFILRTIRWQKNAVKLRDYWKTNNITVPPFMITSITKRCNLKCKGCYSLKFHDACTDEMCNDKLEHIMSEANELGISMNLLAGGEPFVRKNILQITKKFPQIIFPIFTNGLLIDNELMNELKTQKHVIPVLSVEGLEKETDKRRGTGVYNRIQETMRAMKRKGIFFGASLTVTKDNYSTLTSHEFVKEMMNLGCKLLFFVEYVPVTENTENLIVTNEQREDLQEKLTKFYSIYNGLFIAFPGDESKFGGCLSSGRGFVHVSPDGSLEPCPFAPYSDVNIKDMSLKEALKSDFLRKIRQSPEHLKETDSGCALWNNSDWVKSLLS